VCEQQTTFNIASFTLTRKLNSSLQVVGVSCPPNLVSLWAYDRQKAMLAQTQAVHLSIERLGF